MVFKSTPHFIQTLLLSLYFQPISPLTTSSNPCGRSVGLCLMGCFLGCFGLSSKRKRRKPGYRDHVSLLIYFQHSFELITNLLLLLFLLFVLMQQKLCSYEPLDSVSTNLAITGKPVTSEAELRSLTLFTLFFNHLICCCMFRCFGPLSLQLICAQVLFCGVCFFY